jgi:hypothetical protein
VTAWVDRGHYRAGDTVNASFRAQTLDRKPVSGTGKLTLFHIRYDANGTPTETEVESWDLNPNKRGSAEQKLKAAQAGQYRLSYRVTDEAGHGIEGGYLFTVTGQDFNGVAFRFNDLELVTDKREYAPGEKVRVLINTNRIGSTVLLFERPTNGVYLAPHVLRLDGKSTVHELEVKQRDMPNFFLEAMTVSNGAAHTQVREVYVPPVKRVVNVEVLPSEKDYRPGAPATVKLKLTDEEGNPFAGSTVVSIYDKSVEYISGGSNVGSIREFFWKWRRRHSPQSRTSLQRHFAQLLKRGETPMNGIGAFGNLVFEFDKDDWKGLGWPCHRRLRRSHLLTMLPSIHFRGPEVLQGSPRLDPNNSLNRRSAGNSPTPLTGRDRSAPMRMASPRSRSRCRKT